MLPFSKIQSGTFVATAATPTSVQISSMNPPTRIILKNLGGWGELITVKQLEQLT